MSGPADKPRARKRFGQHFLHDPAVIEKILRAIRPQAEDHVVEIGPGRGALTAPLLEHAGALEAVEFDRDLVAALQAGRDGPGRLRVHQADALKFDFAGLGRDLRIVGNLPYNISTPLLFHLLRYTESIRDMHVMVQREVAERMAAGASTPAYGRLSATLAARSRIELLFRLGRGAFQPAPRVESAFVRLVPIPPPFPLASLACYDQLVTRAFSQRRKTLTNALRGLAEPPTLESAGIDPSARAGTVTPRAYGKLSLVLQKGRAI